MNHGHRAARRRPVARHRRRRPPAGARPCVLRRRGEDQPAWAARQTRAGLGRRFDPERGASRHAPRG